MNAPPVTMAQLFNQSSLEGRYSKGNRELLSGPRKTGWGAPLRAARRVQSICFAGQSSMRSTPFKHIIMCMRLHAFEGHSIRKSANACFCMQGRHKVTGSVKT